MGFFFVCSELSNPRRVEKIERVVEIRHGSCLTLTVSRRSGFHFEQSLPDCFVCSTYVDGTCYGSLKNNCDNCPNRNTTSSKRIIVLLLGNQLQEVAAITMEVNRNQAV